MSKHKWHKEIKAWADGAEIEESFLVETIHGEFDWCAWRSTKSPEWETVEYMYRIKPQPNPNLICKSCGQFLHEKQIQIKEPQYLYIYAKGMGMELTLKQLEDRTLIGKIKLEVDDE